MVDARHGDRRSCSGQRKKIKDKLAGVSPQVLMWHGLGPGVVGIVWNGGHCRWSTLWLAGHSCVPANDL